jgi:hypothetical protein
MALEHSMERNGYEPVVEAGRRTPCEDGRYKGYYTLVEAQAGTMAFGGYFLAYDKTSSEVDSILQPFTSQVDNSTATLLSNITRYDSWIDAYNGLPKQQADSTGGPGGVISTTRLLTRRGLTEDIASSAKMFEAIGPSAELNKVGVLCPRFL